MKKMSRVTFAVLLTMTMVMGQASFLPTTVYAAQDDYELTQDDFSDTSQKRSLRSIEFSPRDISDLKQFDVAPIYDVKSNKMLLPRIEGYSVELFGSDRKETVALNGEVTRPLNTQSVKLLYKITNKADGSSITTEKNAIVKIPGQNFDFAGENAKPNVVPALREWVGGDNVVQVNGRIVIDNTALQTAVETFKEDYEAITGRSIAIVNGNEDNLKSGDIFFTLDTSCATLGKEGYYLEIGGADTSKDYVIIRASQTTGALYGGISILQILKQDTEHSNIPKGIARDYPLFERRGMMLDVARKWIPMSYLENLTKQMVWYKLNMVSVHLSDNDIWNSLSTTNGTDPEGFYRLECETFPELVSQQHYTKEEFRNYQQKAMDLGIAVIPELDTPGHALSYTDAWPELSLPNNPKYLDVTNPQVLENMKLIYDEYIHGYEGGKPTFIGDDVNIGTDEYKVSGSVYKEAFRAYCDALLKYVKEQGKNPVFWGSLTENAGSTPVTTDATMFAWYYGYANAKQSLDAGYKIISMEDQEVYIVPGGGYYSNQFGRSEYLYNNWLPNNNSGWAGKPAPAGHPGVIGGQFAVWNDFTGNGISVNDISYRIQHNLYTIAEKCWAGTQQKEEGVSYKQFEENAMRLGDAPNANFLYRDSLETNENEVLKLDDVVVNETKENTGMNIIKDTNISEQVDGKNGKAIALHGGESYMESDAVSTGFGWTNAMWLKLDPENPDNAVLMEGETGTLRIENGKITYDVEQYTHQFEYQIPVDVWTHVALSGTYEGVKLYIDGEFIDELKDKPYPNYNFNSGCNSWTGSYPMVDGKRTQRYYETLMLPLTVLGSKTNAVKASIDEWSIYNRELSGNEVAELAGKAPAVAYMNLALHKKATASGSEAAKFSPDQAVDGKMETRWSSPTSSSAQNDAWFEVDLGTLENVDHVKIAWEAAYAKKYQIFVSEDGIDYREVYKEDNGMGGVTDIHFDMQKVRFVKFQGIERRIDDQWIEAYSFFEFEVYGDKTNDAPKKNVALNKDVTTTYYNDSGSEGNRSGNNAVDGNIETRWEFKLNRTDANTISIPLTENEDVNKIQITERLWGSEATRIKSIKVEAKQNNGNVVLLEESVYTPDETPSGSPRYGVKTINIDTVKADAIEITLTPKAAGADDLVNIAEIAMFGTAIEEETPPVEDGYEKIPHKTMRVFATDEHPNVGVEGLAAFAIDDNTGTWWHTNYSNYKGLPQSITLDLNTVKTIGKYTYLPRTSGTNGNITSYELQGSIDNIEYQTIAEGSWGNDASEKILTFTPNNVRYLRLTAKTGVGNFASAAELNAYTSDDITMEVLQNAVNHANALDTTIYFDESVVALEAAIKQAEDVLAQPFDEVAVKNANEILVHALNTLVLKGDTLLLQNAYDTYSQYVAVDYTAGSFAEFETVLKEIKGLLEREEAVSQVQIDTLILKLEDKAAGLIRLVELKQWISEASAVSFDDSTPTSVAQLKIVLANAKIHLENPDATLYDVVKAQYDIEDALVEMQPDNTALNALIQSYQSQEAQYTVDSWLAFTSALEAAQAVADNADASIDDLYQARTTLQNNADTMLVKKETSCIAKDILKAVIDKTDMYIAEGKLTNVAPNAAALIQLRLKEAKAIYVNPTASDEACLTAWLNLADALHYFDFMADKADLKALIVRCEAIALDQYVEGVEAFKAALANAKAVVEDKNALQERINATYQALEKALEGLVKGDAADKTLLEAIVGMIKDTVKDGSAYQKDQAWSTFQDILASAERVIENEDASQAEVTKVMLDLTNAYENIRLLPNEAILSGLRTFIALIDALDPTQYSAERYAYFQNARHLAANVLENYTDQAYAEVKDVMEDVLTILAEQAPIIPQTPVETEDSTVDMNATDSSKTPSTINGTKGTTKTGDASNVASLSIMLLGATAVFLLRRKRM